MKKLLIFLSVLPLIASSQHQAVIRCQLMPNLQDSVNNYLKKHFTITEDKKHRKVGDTTFSSPAYRTGNYIYIPILDSLGHIIKFAHLYETKEKYGNLLHYDAPMDSAKDQYGNPEDALHKRLEKELVRVLNPLPYRWTVLQNQMQCKGCDSKLYIGYAMQIQFRDYGYPFIRFDLN